MTTERTKLRQELEMALGEVVAHVRGEVASPCRIVDAPGAGLDRRPSEPAEAEPAEIRGPFRPRRAAVQGWEQGLRVPDRATRVLLTVIDRDPESVVRALTRPSETRAP